MPKRERMLWVCQNERAADHPKGSCGAQGAKAIRNQLKAGLVRRGLHRRFRVCESSCLDLCWVGPTIALMPDNVFYGPVTENDVSVILDSLESDTVVERLKVPPDRFDDPNVSAPNDKEKAP